MKRFAAVMCAATLAAAQLAAADTKVHIDGIGAMKCTAIVTGLKERPAEAANAVLGWTYGYMARRNIERGAAGKPQVAYSSTEAEKIIGIIGGFCSEKENADARLYQIADSLYDILLEDTPMS
jgi:hypothetical protein